MKRTDFDPALCVKKDAIRLDISMDEPFLTLTFTFTFALPFLPISLPLFTFSILRRIVMKWMMRVQG
jgi:hypothetical protein